MNEFEGGNALTSIAREEHSKSMGAIKITDVGSNLQEKIDFESGNLGYVGLGRKGLNTDEKGWLISKYTFNNGNQVSIQTAIGAWNDRAELTYS